jgi:hypothetical protein
LKAPASSGAFAFGRLSWRPLSFQIQNRFNTIATKKLAIPSTNNQLVV